MKEAITKEKLIQDLRRVGVQAGDLLHLKVSMRSIGKVEDGASTVLQALLEVVGPEGSLISDAFIKVYPLPLDAAAKMQVADAHTASYAGAFANEMIKHPDMVRSKHPIQKYAGIGTQAKELCDAHTPDSGGYELLDYMADMGAKNLTIGEKVVGVGTTHVAIDKLGLQRRKLNLGRLYKAENGDTKLAKVDWNGGCARGFQKFIPEYYKGEAVIGDGKVGEANALLTSMKKTLEIEKEILEKDPGFFLCDDKACYSCQMTWDHSPKKRIAFYSRWLLQNLTSLSPSRLKRLLKTTRKA